MASSPPAYFFDRDYRDNSRINLQHYYWEQLFGYLTHPSISLNNARMRIADVGTGTAIWLSELASSLPETVQLDGLDVSLQAAPPPQWLPANVTLRRFDIKNPAVPPELIGAYDVVHIRNFAFVLRDDEIPGSLARLVALLRPGGYLQWGEADVASFRIEKVTAAPAARDTTNGKRDEGPNGTNLTAQDREIQTDALARLFRLSQSQDPRLSPTWVPRLPGLFLAAGLENVQADVRDAPPHLAFSMHEGNLSVHEMIARQTKKKEAVLEELSELMPLVASETHQGACWAFTRRTVVGRKSAAGRRRVVVSGASG
ncbi:hypothetical protein C8A03DRAFT_48307 [Achaetomium macrosporum]|uniref:Methyltransferase domain-containing protein n=1 Tax=Achaetomium macrosporum TaxID=79813 RepID=A0AAN7C0D9_9PEZI|nr:hypothetical protein C8A03DRAFT_48307 [Achaetomium macrosporum]